MMKEPPPIPKANNTPAAKSRKVLWISLVIIVLIAVLGIVLGVKVIIDSGITRGPDQMFGDQHLKTSVALIELHKVRYGHYPKTLNDLKFIGQWDKIHLQSVRYYPGKDLQSYYIEVSRGWVGKPDLSLPDEFWQGTGFDASLKPQKK